MILLVICVLIYCQSILCVMFVHGLPVGDNMLNHFIVDNGSHFLFEFLTILLCRFKKDDKRFISSSHAFLSRIVYQHTHIAGRQTATSMLQ